MDSAALAAAAFCLPAPPVVAPPNPGSLSTNSMRHTPSNFTLNGWYLSCSLQW